MVYRKPVCVGAGAGGCSPQAQGPDLGSFPETTLCVDVGLGSLVTSMLCPLTTGVPHLSQQTFIAMKTSQELPEHFFPPSLSHVSREGEACPLQWISMFTEAPECSRHSSERSPDLTFRNSPGWKSGQDLQRLVWEHSGLYKVFVMPGGDSTATKGKIEPSDC